MLTIISLGPDRQIFPRDKFPEHRVSFSVVVVLARGQLHFCFIVEVELQILSLFLRGESKKRIFLYLVLLAPKFFNFWY